MYKKIYSTLLIFLLSGILFSSCGINYTLKKRHYSKGYYFSGGRDKSGDAKEDEAKLESVRTEKEVKKMTILSNEDNHSIVVNHSTAKQEITTVPSLSEKSLKESTIAPIGKEQENKGSRFQREGMKSAKKGIHSDSMKDSSEGLSLFWIVILIILILWAIGFIGGSIGGLINLLLLVALILLILWLLRVV